MSTAHTFPSNTGYYYRLQQATHNTQLQIFDNISIKKNKPLYAHEHLSTMLGITLSGNMLHCIVQLGVLTGMATVLFWDVWGFRRWRNIGKNITCTTFCTPAGVFTAVQEAGLFPQWRQVSRLPLHLGFALTDKRIFCCFWRHLSRLDTARTVLHKAILCTLLWNCRFCNI